MAMFPILRSVRVRSFEKGLLFRNGEFERVLGEGRHWLFDPFFDARVDLVSARAPWLVHRDLDLIVKSGQLDGHATVVELTDTERALVWIDGRFDTVLGPGRYALWTTVCDVRVETIDVRRVRFEHEAVAAILNDSASSGFLTAHTVAQGQLGLIYLDGAFVETVGPGPSGA